MNRSRLFIATAERRPEAGALQPDGVTLTGKIEKREILLPTAEKATR